MAKILVVEDDFAIGDTLYELLTREGHEAEIVQTGTEGWSEAQTNQYELLILDWDLPDLNGINILRRYRKAGFKAPVIMLTGHGSVSDKELGLDSGADDYLTKPFALDELMARIRALLRRMETQASVYKSLGNPELLKKANLEGTQVSTRFEFLEVIGEGAIGIVFKARQALIEKLVAIKMLKGNQNHLEEVANRFTREAKAVSRLDHENIIGIIDFGITENGQAFMVMNYVVGWSLDGLLKNQGAFPLDFSLDVGIQICRGMAHAHTNGVLHRDLKPANILLKRYEDRAAQVKIVDFGLAKLSNSESKDSPELTRDGQIIGSPMYMSPEQARGLPMDERSDIYSLGCIIYEMLTGCPPHFADNSMDMIMKQLSEEPLPLTELRPDLSYPAAFEPLIRKAINKESSKRYQSMRELQNDLEQIKADLTQTIGSPSK